MLLGFNFSQNASLVLPPGLAYAQNTAASNVYATGVAGSSTAAGFMARLGVGVDFSVSRGLAIQPEVTLMRECTGSEDLLLCVGGLGFNFGAQPDYSDLATAEKPSDTQPPPPAASPPSETTPTEAPPTPSAPSPPAGPPSGTDVTL